MLAMLYRVHQAHITPANTTTLYRLLFLQSLTWHLAERGNRHRGRPSSEPNLPYL